MLFVGRLEPENNPHVLVEAFANIPTEQTKGMKLVVVGGAPYADEYIRGVMREGDPRVIFPGYVFGRGYWELQRHAYAFVAPTEVGGTHPVILEALAAGNCVLVNDHPPNVETVGDAGLYFSGRGGVSSLAEQLGRLLDDPSSSRSTGPAPGCARAPTPGTGHRRVRAPARGRARGEPPGPSPARIDQLEGCLCRP